MKFNVGDKVEHILSGDWMLVLECDGSIVNCRRKDLSVVALNEWELRKVK